MSCSSFFDAEKISKKFIFPAVTIRKVHGREVVSFCRVASLIAYKYSRDSFIGTLETRLLRRSIVPHTATIEKIRVASTNCDVTTDQLNASPQTSPNRVPINETHSVWGQPEKRVLTVIEANHCTVSCILLH